MTRFTTELTIATSAQQVWDLVTTWTAHERFIPLTRIRILSSSATGIGARFVARTALGPFGVDDVMEVTTWAPPAGDLPGRWSVVKQGRFVHGGAQFQVQNVQAGSSPVTCRVIWSEELSLAPERLTWPLSPLVKGVGRLGLVRALRIMAHELES